MKAMAIAVLNLAEFFAVAALDTVRPVQAAGKGPKKI